MPVMNLLTPTCEVVSHKISESLDHKLPIMDRIRVRLHLMGCELCARYEKQLHAIHHVIEKSLNEPPENLEEAKLSDDARHRMKQELKQNSK